MPAYILLAVRLTSAVPQTKATPSAPAPAPAQSSTGNRALPIGGGVRTPPVVAAQMAPNYTEEARKNKVSGNAVVSLVVDINGQPQNVRVFRV